MQNPCDARLLSSLFGTVSMGETMQTLDVLALYNLFMKVPCGAGRQGRTAGAPGSIAEWCSATHVLFYSYLIVYWK